MTTLAPRVVVVSRPSELTELLGRHGTRAAAAYFLRERGRSLDEVDARHEALQAALAGVGAAIPADWRRGHVSRADLPRFLFAPEDVVIAVGQDGLVANVAKYLSGQPVIGVDPEPDRNPGVLVRHAAGSVAPLLRAAVAGRAGVQARTMVAACLDDGQELLGLNEIYFGHATHQSSRYTLRDPASGNERHSSSGVIVSTGTGATGWTYSISRQRADAPALPDPDEKALCWFVREAWPSPGTGVRLTSGLIGAGQKLELISEAESQVVFADGVEADHLVLAFGQRLEVSVAPRQLRLVLGA
ncbi:NAD(+)/NADH kinase [Luedemannella flava]|uniref:NAD(+)/NADH kinase n=1 Tax=Luedemannella flava TaxID=349316 RepID=A0ABP4YDH9_9ACTN